jgi:hypothetical protein
MVRLAGPPGDLGARADQLHDFSGLRVPPKFLLRENEVAVDGDFEDAALRRDDEEG